MKTQVPAVHRFAHTAMATLFEIRCAHADPGYAQKAAQEAFALVDRLEQELSLFVANSDISRINELKAGRATRVSPSTMECLEIAWRLHDMTGGAFDVSLGSGLEGLELVSDGFVVHARAAGVRLDLGGLGKGFAVDRVAELLEEWEVRHALVHGGFSSVLALESPPDGDGWPLTLSAPEPGDLSENSTLSDTSAVPRILARISVRQTALSASGTRKRDHIVDPRTGRPVPSRAVWVAVGGREDGRSGSEASVAEGLSTAFMVLSPEESADLCRRCTGVEAWLFEAPTLVHVAPSPRSGASNGE